MDASRDQLDRVDRSRLVDSGGSHDDSLSWNLSRVKQGDAIRVDSTCSRRRRQVCKCGCFNHGNVISSECDDRLGSLEVAVVAVVGNLRSTVRLRTRRPRNARGRVSNVQTRQSQAKNLEMSGNARTQCS